METLSTYTDISMAPIQHAPEQKVTPLQDSNQPNCESLVLARENARELADLSTQCFWKKKFEEKSSELSIKTNLKKMNSRSFSR
jgi:hypothetical protein